MTLATQNMGAIDNESGHLSEGEAAEEMLRRFLPPEEGTDASKSSGKKKNEDDEQGTSGSDDEDNGSAEKPEQEDTSEGTEDQDGETDDDSDVADKKFADEAGTFVKIKVGDEEHEVPVSKLTRLYGQEAALTKKSMEVAEQRKSYDTKLQEQVSTTAALLERAKVRYDPYSKIDFNLLATQVTPEEYSALRQAAQSAYEDVQFLEQHTGAFMQHISAQQQHTLMSQAQEAIKILSGPADKGGIEGWGQKHYDDLRSYAMSKGAPAEIVNTIVDPWAIRIIDSAMKFERGKAKGGGTVTVTKVNKTPKRIVKTTNSPESARGDGKSSAAKRAMTRFESSGSTDDAAEALLTRWAVQSDD